MKLRTYLLAVFVAAPVILSVASVAAANVTPPNSGSTGSQVTPAGSCSGGDFLFFPTWYKYLPGKIDSNGLCSPQLNSISDVWLIVAAVIEILLRVAAVAAVIMVIYGGVHYIVSQGEPDDTNKARSTIINALIGLLLSVMAAAFINFIARSLT